MTKPVVNPSKGAKSGGKFTFNVISPEKERPAEEVSSDWCRAVVRMICTVKL